jgi:hypothetical protein
MDQDGHLPEQWVGRGGGFVVHDHVQAQPLHCGLQLTHRPIHRVGADRQGLGLGDVEDTVTPFLAQTFMDGRHVPALVQPLGTIDGLVANSRAASRAVSMLDPFSSVNRCYGSVKVIRFSYSNEDTKGEEEGKS